MGFLLTRRVRLALRCCVSLLLYSGFATSAHAQDTKKPPALPSPPAQSTTPPPALAPIPAPIFQPNEIDLKASYCRPVIAAAVGEHQKALNANLPANLRNAAKERHAVAVDRARRLEFYLLPRLNALKSAALLDAQARGYTDVASLAELSRTCDVKCGGIAAPAASTSCRQRCNEGSEAAKRARDCDDISWLPLKDA